MVTASAIAHRPGTCGDLGPDLVAESFAEPLVAPPDGYMWSLHWSSEHPRYGGIGTPDIVGDHGWRIPGHSAVVLAPAPAEFSLP